MLTKSGSKLLRLVDNHDRHKTLVANFNLLPNFVSSKIFMNLNILRKCMDLSLSLTCMLWPTQLQTQIVWLLWFLDIQHTCTLCLIMHSFCEKWLVTSWGFWIAYPSSWTHSNVEVRSWITVKWGHPILGYSLSNYQLWCCIVRYMYVGSLK